MVLRLCRSVLRDEHEAQDAFQATFLVLAQKAKSLCVRDSLGPWIHSVAYRVAACARAAAIRRRRHARRHGELAAGRLAVYQDGDHGDLEAVVHEEIDRLPKHFRTPLVLCDLQGCSHEQAARQLGWPVGTVKSRQARGRQRLRDRLIKRGLAPSPAMALGSALMPEIAVPPALMKSTANLATICAGADSARVAVLAREVLTIMLVGLGGAGSGSRPVWSSDGKQIMLSLISSGKPPWVHATRRVHIDGTGLEELPVPPEDTVQDWSSDGRWLVTASSRGAKNDSWQLYIMRPDGTEQRRITEEGNPFYARFSPDGRRVLYTDNGRGEQSGIWVVDADGKNARLVFPVAPPPLVAVASACWSPDGKRIAITLAGLERTERLPWPVQIVVMDSGGGHRSEIHIPEGGMTDLPDWR